MRLKDKIAIVVGGASGIGYAVCEMFVKEGATVVPADINGAKLPEIEAALKALGNEKGYAVQCDMTDFEQVNALVSGVKEKLGRVDIMFCGGGASWNTPFAEMDVEEWNKMLHMHLDSAFYCAKAAASVMVPQNYGRLIFISSGRAMRGDAAKVHYSAAKGGVMAFVRALGAELGPHGITVNSIAPGLTVTPLVQSQMSPEALAAASASMPDKHLGRPEDIAALALLMASEDGGHINCQNWPVDGGDSVASAKRI